VICYSCLQAETLGCEGNVDQAQKVMVLCEQSRSERTTLIGVSCTLWCFIAVIRDNETTLTSSVWFMQFLPKIKIHFWFYIYQKFVLGFFILRFLQFLNIWQWHMCVNNLAKVVTLKQNGQDLSLCPSDSQVRRPNHYATRTHIKTTA